VLIVRIKQAETALANGRLDEAFELARNRDFQAHRRGQQLIDALAKAFVARGNEHLDGERFNQASSDCAKAGKLSGNMSDVARLRDAIAQAVTDRNGSDRKRGDVKAAVREHMDDGRLSVAEHLLERMPGETGSAEALRAVTADRRLATQDAMTRARDAMELEDWDTAVRALLEIKRSHAANKQLPALIAQLGDRITAQALSAVNEGRVDLAESLLHRLVPYG